MIVVDYLFPIAVASVAAVLLYCNWYILCNKKNNIQLIVDDIHLEHERMDQRSDPLLYPVDSIWATNILE